MRSHFKDKYLIFISLFLLLSTKVAFADVRTWRLTQIVGDHQDSTSTVTVDSSGVVSFHSRFSNGHKTDGDHFVAEVVGRDTAGNPIFTGSHGAGVNASFGGKTRVVTVNKSLTISAEKASSVSYLEARHYQKDTKGEWGFIVEYSDKDGDGEYEWKFDRIVDPIKDTVPGPFSRMMTVPPCEGYPKREYRETINSNGVLVRQSCQILCEPSGNDQGRNERRQCHEIGAVLEGFGTDRPDLIKRVE